MDPRLARPRLYTLAGALRVFAGESLLIPTGLLITAYLTRSFGPQGYGLFVLTISLIIWIESSVTTIFSYATVKLVSESEDERAAASAVLSLYLSVGLATALIVIGLSPQIATFFGEPALLGYLRLFALDIPLFSFVQAHRSILVGMGSFKDRALMSATRWLTRLALVFLLVGAGLSIEGAILASIGASLAEAAYARWRIALWPSFSPMQHLRKLGAYLSPLIAYVISIRLFSQMGLFALKSLGRSSAEVGQYGAAQNLSILPGIFALSFSPLLLSTLNRLLRSGAKHNAHALGRDAMRLILVLFPFACLFAGAAGEVVVWVLGPGFLPSTPLVRLLIFAALSQAMLSITVAIITAAKRARLTAALSLGMLLFAALGHALLIPRLGPVGASLVTLMFSFTAALLNVLIVFRIWGVHPPRSTLLRSAFVGVPAFVVAYYWHTPGPLLLLKLGLLSLIVVAAYRMLGEFGPQEISQMRLILNGRFSES